jgi:hypothetical protein
VARVDRSAWPGDDASFTVLVDALRGFPAPWAVAGGWALDLFLGCATRPHADVDACLFRADQAALHRHLAGWELRKVVGGELFSWPAGEWLSLPVHEIHARRADNPTRSIELLLNERDGDDWVFRRNAAARCPAGRVIRRSGAGPPILCPAVVLLYKAKAPRAVDEHDFEVVRGSLAPAQRHWLRAALAVCHPGHPWLARL